MKGDPNPWFLYSHEKKHIPLFDHDANFAQYRLSQIEKDKEEQRNQLQKFKNRFNHLCRKYNYVDESLKEDLKQAMVRVSYGGFTSSVGILSLRSDRDISLYHKQKQRYQDQRRDAKELKECKDLFGFVCDLIK